ncbi:hypothetical protein K4F52_005720 [Lecanicillium sp. MT-2017a]|nr:hypothetical protein K4F52_005720 [Lecanicillium sp. MT-2017a]
MKFFAVLALAGAAVAYSPCSGLSGNPVCCGASVLDVAVLNCAAPRKYPKDASDFQSICAQRGNSPKCCVLGLAGQGLLCNTPVGVSS